MPKHQTVKTQPDGWGIKWPPVGSFPWPRSRRGAMATFTDSRTADRATASPPRGRAEGPEQLLNGALSVGTGVLVGLIRAATGAL
jgi:hypothetical protein